MKTLTVALSSVALLLLFLSLLVSAASSRVAPAPCHPHTSTGNFNPCARLDVSQVVIAHN